MPEFVLCNCQHSLMVCSAMSEHVLIHLIPKERDLKHRQRNGRRRFETEADWAKGFVFGGENKVWAVQLPRQTTTFSLRRTLSCYSLVMAFKDLRNLHVISYDDGLIDDGKFIVVYNLYKLYYLILEALFSSRSFNYGEMTPYTKPATTKRNLKGASLHILLQGKIS